MNIIVIIRAISIPKLYIVGVIKFCSQFKGTKLKLIYKIKIIEYKESNIVQNAVRYDAEIIIGAIIKIIKGLNTPPVKYNKPTNCEISNSKNAKVFLSLKVGLSFWIKYEKILIIIDNRTTIKHASKGIEKFKVK